MLALIFKANKTEKKAGYIASAREKLVEVQVISRILNDLKQNAIRRRATQPGRNAAQSRLAAACQGNFRQSACYIRVTCFSFKTSPEDLLLDLYRAYKDARRHKRRKRNVQQFSYNVEEELVKLRDEILGRRYASSPSICFMDKANGASQIGGFM